MGGNTPLERSALQRVKNSGLQERPSGTMRFDSSSCLLLAPHDAPLAFAGLTIAGISLESSPMRWGGAFLPDPFQLVRETLARQRQTTQRNPVRLFNVV